MRELHFQQIREFGFCLKLHRHVIVKNPNATLGFDSPQTLKLRR
jgi:hypothetical protein